ncbi:MAG TPA: hypothetical protein VLT86_15265 [Vicinamibacterales bacterium]|nr:hypothetical protein [Vicinamibacterales bacterium]
MVLRATRGRAARLAVATMIAGAIWPAAARAQGSPQQVYAIVVDGDGLPVRGLSAEDFSLRDGSVRQQVLGVEPATNPIWIAVVVRGFAAEDRATVRTAVGAVVEALQSQAGSRVGVMHARPGGRSEWVDATSGLADSVWDAVLAPGSGAVTDAIADACVALRSAPTDRRAVLTLIQRRPDDAVVAMTGLLTDALFQSSAALWTVEIPAPAATPAASSLPARGAKLDDVLTDATKFSGALRERAADPAGLAPMAARVAHLLLAQYIVSYLWPNPMLSQFSIATRHDRGDVLVPAWAR